MASRRWSLGMSKQSCRMAGCLIPMTWPMTSHSMAWMSSASSTVGSRRRLRSPQELQVLRSKFNGEDKGWNQVLRDAYESGKKPPEKDPRMPEAERARLLQAKEEHLRAAQLTAIGWAQRALLALRESAPLWLATIVESQAPLRDELEQLNARIDTLKTELLADDRLRLWLERTLQAIPGNHFPFVQQPVSKNPSSRKCSAHMGRLRSARHRRAWPPLPTTGGTAA